MDNKQKVLRVLKETGTPMKAGELVSTLGMSDKDVARAIKELKEEGLIDSPKRCYYAPVK